MVSALAHHAFYPAVDDEHGTGSARGHAAVESGSVYGNPDLCGLTDRVLFGVNSPDAVGGNIAVFMESFLELMADLVAVGQAGGGADIARNQNLPVLGNYAA
jgi:hypothetical protein